MNSTVATGDGPDDMGTRTIGGFGYSLGLSLGSLLIIIIVTCAAYAYTRTRVAANPTTSHRSATIDSDDDDDDDDDDSVTIHVQGLDEATLLTYPKLLYSQAKLHQNGDSAATGCSICLADYKATDTLRLLPDCGHLFHLECIDPWLVLHPTCPICRSSPKPSPLSLSNGQVFPSSAGNGHLLQA